MDIGPLPLPVAQGATAAASQTIATPVSDVPSAAGPFAAYLQDALQGSAIPGPASPQKSLVLDAGSGVQSADTKAAPDLALGEGPGKPGDLIPDAGAMTLATGSLLAAMALVRPQVAAAELVAASSVQGETIDEGTQRVGQFGPAPSPAVAAGSPYVGASARTAPPTSLSKNGDFAKSTIESLSSVAGTSPTASEAQVQPMRSQLELTPATTTDSSSEPAALATPAPTEIAAASDASDNLETVGVRADAGLLGSAIETREASGVTASQPSLDPPGSEVESSGDTGSVRSRDGAERLRVALTGTVSQVGIQSDGFTGSSNSGDLTEHPPQFAGLVESAAASSAHRDVEVGESSIPRTLDPVNAAAISSEATTSYSGVAGTKQGASPSAEASPQQLSVAGQIADHVRQLDYPRNSQIRVHLHPEDLGSVELRLGMRAGVLTLEIQASTLHGHSIIESAIPQLRSALLDRGIDVGSLSLSSGQTASGSGSYADLGQRGTGTYSAWSGGDGNLPHRTPDRGLASQSVLSEAQGDSENRDMLASDHLVDLRV